MIIDTHAHYDDAQYEGELDSLLSELFSGGVGQIITCATRLEDCERVLRLAERFEGLYAALGVYPHETHTSSWDGERLTALLSHKKAVAIGEIGLDYYYDDSPRAVQLEWARRQLSLAVQLDMPISFHDREAHADTLELLQQYRPRGVVHCFSGSEQMAQQLVEIGMYIGVGGAVTFRNARRLPDVVKSTPLERIVLETDAPYMTPEPFRGKRNRSDYIKYIAEKIAQLKGVSYQTVVQQTAENARALFKFGE